MDHAEGFETSFDENENDKDTKPKKRRMECHCFPKRYVVALLSFLGFLNVYSLRVNLSVALVAMVSNRTRLNDDGTRTLLEPAEFHWDSKLQGVILSSFFYGYIFTQIPGGYLAARYGGKNLFGGGILMTAVFTLLTPVATRIHVYLLITLRILEGFFEGVTFPCMHAIWRKWAPPLERSKLATISFSGPFAGTVLSMTLSGILADNHGWGSVFYCFGALAVIWSFFWFWLVTDSPHDHPTISQEELDLISKSLSADKTEMKVRGTPWKEMFTSLPFIAIIVAHTTENWGYYTLLTSLPMYLKKVLHFDLKEAGFLASLPYLVMVLVVQSGGRLADFFRRRKILSTTNVRKVFNTLGFLAQAVFMVIVGYTTDKDFAVVGLTCAVGMGGLAWSGFPVNHLDIAPRYASLLLGISNCAATLPGIFSPLLVGYITTNETQAEWRIVFYIAGAVYVLGMIFYAIFASGEKQPWAEHDQYEQLGTDEVELLENDGVAEENTDGITKESSKEKSQ